MRYGLLCLVAMSVSFASPSRATVERWLDQTLVRWSLDGETWVTRIKAKADGSQYVYYSVNVRDEANVLFGQRIPQAKWKAFDKQHSYLRVSTKWNKAFRQRFAIEYSDKKRKPRNGKDCYGAWRIIDRNKRVEVFSHHARQVKMQDRKAPQACTRFQKGYLHPSGKFFVLQYSENSWDRWPPYPTLVWHPLAPLPVGLDPR